MDDEQKNNEQGRSAEALRRYADRLRILHEIDHAILRARSLEAISEAVLGNIDQLLPNCEWACVALFDQNAQKAIVLAAHSNKFNTFNHNEHLPIESFRRGGNPLDQTDAYIIGDLSVLDAPTFVEKTLIEHGMRAYMSIPLIVQAKVIGSFNISSHQEEIYSKDCADIAHEVSNSLAIAIENTRLIEVERSHNQELLTMTLVSAALRMAKTRAEISPIILDQLQRLFQANSTLLAKYDMPKQELEIELGLGYWSKATGERFPEAKCVLFGKVISTKCPYISNDILNDPSFFLPDFIGKISSVAFVPLITQGKAIGALGIGRQTPITESDVRLLMSIADMVANTIQSVTLTDDLQRSNAELARAYDSTLEGWGRALELRDRETEGHTQRVTALTMKLARLMGIAGDELTQLRRGVILHDIGKMGVPDHILLKPGPLNDAEWEIMRQHPRFAYDMLAPIHFLHGSIDIPYCHHEKWDGSGYPRQLVGEQIPLSARIFAICDVFDALTSSGRPYRDAWSKEKALEYIRLQRGGHFDPQVVDAFLNVFR